MIIAFLFLFLISPQQTLPTNTQIQSNHPEPINNSNYVRYSAQVPTVPTETQWNTQSHENKYKETTTRSEKDSEGWIGIVNTIDSTCLVVFTGLTACIFLYQIKITHDAERAWILITNWEEPEHIDWREIRTNIYPTESFTWTIQNTGRTPARISAVQLRFRFIQNLSDLPSRPDYGDGKCMLIDKIPTDGAVLRQNEPEKISTYFEGPHGEPGAPTQAQMDAVRSGKAFLITYGSIRYRDIFKRKHETRFCYVYHIRAGKPATAGFGGWFSAGGPEEYNHTN